MSALIIVKNIIKIQLILIMSIFIYVNANAQDEIEYYSDPIEKNIYSHSFLKNKNVTLILPTTYNKNRKKKYPLIIVFDRQNKSIFKQICESIIYLNRFDEIPEVIIVGITSDPKDRTLETTFKSENKNGRGEEMTNFVFNELIPWCESNYNTGFCRTIIGHSRFGYFTTSLMCSQYENLTGVISLSPFFYQKNLSLVDSVISNFSQSNKLQNRIYYRFVTGDSLSDTSDYYSMKKALAKTPLSSKFDWEAYAFYNAKHNVVPGLGVMPSLLSIFNSWSTLADELSPYKRSTDTLSYTKYLKQTKIDYGEELNLGLARLNGLGSDFFNKKRYPEARFFWEELLRDYPFYSPIYLDLTEVFLAEGKKKQAIKTLQKGLLSLKSNKFLPKKLQDIIRANMLNKLILLQN